jgi:hypothetical protein
MAHGHDSAAVMKGLRAVFDSNSQFISGHQIKRVSTLNERKKVPAWALEDESIRKLLLFCFPKLLSNDVQRKRAGRYLRIIQLFFRSKKSRREVAEELGESENVIRRIVYRYVKLAQKEERYSAHKKCSHGRRKSQCRECGTGYCEHRRQKWSCGQCKSIGK